MARCITQQTGQPLDTGLLNRDLLRASRFAGNTFSLRGAYQKTWLDRLGASVVGWRGSYTGSTHGRLRVQDLARLGGFLNLSGFAVGELAGDKISHAHVRAERIVGAP